MNRKKDTGKRFHYIIYHVLKITQTEFSELIGVSRTQVNAYVKGTSFPGDEVMQRIQEIGINPRFIEYTDEVKIFAANEAGEKLKLEFYKDRFNLADTKEKDDQISKLQQKVDKLELFIREKFVDYNGQH